MPGIQLVVENLTRRIVAELEGVSYVTVEKFCRAIQLYTHPYY